MMMYYYLLIAGAHGRHGKRNSLSLAPAHDHPSAIGVHRPPSKLDSADLKAQSCLMSRPDLLSTTSKSNRAQYLLGLTEPHSTCPSPSKNICGYCPSYTCPLPIIFHDHDHHHRRRRRETSWADTNKNNSQENEGASIIPLPPQRHGKDFLKKKVHLPTSIPWYSSKDNDNKAPEKPPRPQDFSLSLSLKMSRTMKEYLSFSCQEGAYLPLPPPMIEEVRKAAAPREDERRAREQRRGKRERQSLSTTYITYLPTFDLPCSHPPFLPHIGSKQRERRGEIASQSCQFQSQRRIQTKIKEQNKNKNNLHIGRGLS